MLINHYQIVLKDTYMQISTSTPHLTFYVNYFPIFHHYVMFIYDDVLRTTVFKFTAINYLDALQKINFLSCDITQYKNSNITSYEKLSSYKLEYHNDPYVKKLKSLLPEIITDIQHIICQDRGI